MFDYEIPNHVNKSDILKIRETPKMFTACWNGRKLAFHPSELLD